MFFNPDKNHFMCIGKEIDDAVTLHFNDLAIKIVKNCKYQEQHQIENMNFHAQIKHICRKAGQKLSALLRISSYLDQGKKI